MAKVTNTIFNNGKLSVFIEGLIDGRIQGYKLNSKFYYKKDRKQFLLDLKELDPINFKEIVLKLEENEKRYHERLNKD